MSTTFNLRTVQLPKKFSACSSLTDVATGVNIAFASHSEKVDFLIVNCKLHYIFCSLSTVKFSSLSSSLESQISFFGTRTCTSKLDCVCLENNQCKTFVVRALSKRAASYRPTSYLL